MVKSFCLILFPDPALTSPQPPIGGGSARSDNGGGNPRHCPPDAGKLPPLIPSRTNSSRCREETASLGQSAFTRMAELKSTNSTRQPHAAGFAAVLIRDLSARTTRRMFRLVKCGRSSMKHTAVCLGLWFAVQSCLAQSTTTFYYDKTGSSAGKSITAGSRTTCYDKTGSTAGSSQRSGNTTFYYDRTGSSAGRSTTVGSRTIYYDKSGSTLGSSQTSGGSTFYYDKTGSSCGKAVTSGRRTYYYDKSGSSIGSSQTSK